MIRLDKMLFTLCLLCVLPALAQGQENAQRKLSEARGELLYMAHCNTCHTSQVHWREQKLAADWHSLVAQVRRWQAIGGLNWNEEEVTDVANYLNAVFYKYINTAQIKNPNQYLIRK
jgi:mono/diheme cytochrome c family protein